MIGTNVQPDGTFLHRSLPKKPLKVDGVWTSSYLSLQGKEIVKLVVVELPLTNSTQRLQSPSNIYEEGVCVGERRTAFPMAANQRCWRKKKKIEKGKDTYLQLDETQSLARAARRKTHRENIEWNRQSTFAFSYLVVVFSIPLITSSGHTRAVKHCRLLHWLTLPTAPLYRESTALSLSSLNQIVTAKEVSPCVFCSCSRWSALAPNTWRTREMKSEANLLWFLATLLRTRHYHQEDHRSLRPPDQWSVPELIGPLATHNSSLVAFCCCSFQVPLAHSSPASIVPDSTVLENRPIKLPDKVSSLPVFLFLYRCLLFEGKGCQINSGFVVCFFETRTLFF